LAALHDAAQYVMSKVENLQQILIQSCNLLHDAVTHVTGSEYSMLIPYSMRSSTALYTASEVTPDVRAFIAAVNSADALFLQAVGSQYNTVSDNTDSTDDSFKTIVDILKRDGVLIEKATEVCTSVSTLYNIHWSNYCNSVRQSVATDASSKAKLYAKLQQLVDKWQGCITLARTLRERLELYKKQIDIKCAELYELNIQRLTKGVGSLATAVKQLVSATEKYF
jgi:hypothetical protein